MGILGRKLGRMLGGKIGKFAGDRLGKYTGIDGKAGGQTGRAIGAKLGSLVGFKKGGPVKKTGPALIHRGEYVLPAGVKPTAKQRKAVSKRRRR